MNHSEDSIKGVRAAIIYYQAWLPDGASRAVRLMVHGLGGHSGRPMNLVNAVVPLGIAVYAFDHIGHGKPDGGREVIEPF